MLHGSDRVIEDDRKIIHAVTSYKYQTGNGLKFSLRHCGRCQHDLQAVKYMLFFTQAMHAHGYI